MGLLSTPYFLCLHNFGPTVAHSHFSTSYTTHGFAIPLFLGFFKPVCFLKAHLSILWTCDPLFLSLGLNGFFLFIYQFFYAHVAGLLSIWLPQNNRQQLQTFEFMFDLHLIKGVLDISNELSHAPMKRSRYYECYEVG